MTVGITGASGHLAASAVGYLLERTSPSDVIAVTRTPAKLDTLARQGIRVRSADFNDPSGLAKAFDGVNRLLIIPTPDLMPGVRPRQHTAAIDAAVAAGVAHIIYISTVGAHPGSSDGLPESHFATERRLIASSAAWNVLRMSLFAETLVDPATRAAGSGTWSALESAPISYVARDDVAAAAAGLLLGKGHDGYTYHATGPQALTPSDVARIVSQTIGVNVAITPQTPAQYEAGLAGAGLPPWLVDILLRFQQDARDGLFDLVTGDVERLSGRRAESVADFLSRRVGPSGPARTSR